MADTAGTAVDARTAPGLDPFVPGALPPGNGAGREEGSHPFARLLELVHDVAVPSAPPYVAPADEVLGLNLIALALRMEHVERLSESLELSDWTYMDRRVSVDLALDSLTGEQRQALRTDPGGTGEPASVWLPLARHARSTLVPVVVRSSSGAVLPRLTGLETGRVVVAGLLRLLRMFLDADPRSSEPGHVLSELRGAHARSYWLVEAAVRELVEGSVSMPAVRRSPPHPPRPTHPDAIRDRAEEALRALFGPDDPFVSLLDVAVSQFVLVAQIDLRDGRANLEYRAPVLPADTEGPDGGEGAGTRPARVRRPSWVPVGQQFTVEYETVVPRAVDSYHLTVEVAPEIQIRRLIMTSDADRPEVAGLVADVRAVIGRYDVLQRLPDKVLEQELQSIASRLAALGRRRYRDLETYRAYLRACYREFGARSGPRERPGALSAADVLQRLDAGERVVEVLARFSHAYEAGEYPKLAKLLDRDRLARLADRLEDDELALDLQVDNDPRDSGAHAQWRRSDHGGSAHEPVTVRVYVALAGDRPSLAANVSWLLVAVLALVGGLSLMLHPALYAGVPGLAGLSRVAGEGILARTSGALSSADALVTMLLLVPGLLLTRLDLPSRKTVLGRLRQLPGYLAYGAVVVASALGLSVAALPGRALGLPLRLAVGAILLLLAVASVDGVLRSVRRRMRVPAYRSVPVWLIEEIAGRPRSRRRRRPVVEFSGIGPQSRA